jgi:hypothetical protein
VTQYKEARKERTDLQAGEVGDIGIASAGLARTADRQLLARRRRCWREGELWKDLHWQARVRRRAALDELGWTRFSDGRQRIGRKSAQANEYTPLRPSGVS